MSNINILLKMKKKFFVFWAMAVFFLSAATLFVSCKDTDEDLYAEMEGKYRDLVGENATLQELLNAQIAALANARAELENQINAVNAALSSDIDRLNEELNSESQERIDGINHLNNALAQEIADRKAADKLLNDAIDVLNEALVQLKADTNASLADLAEKIAAANKAAIEAGTLAQKAYDLAEQANELAKANAVEIAGLKKTVETLQGTVQGMSEQLTKVTTDAADALAQAKANAAAIEALNGKYADVAKDIEDMKEEAAAAVAEAQANFDKAIALVNEALAKVQKELASLKDDVASQGKEIEGVKGDVNTLNVHVSDMEKAYQAADKELQSQIDALKKQIESLEKEMNSMFDTLKNAIASNISGIVIQGAYSPVTGYFALPINVRSNILAAYYGEPVAVAGEVEFPTTRRPFYVNPDDAFTAEEVAAIGGFNGKIKAEADYIIDEAEGNAGTLYITVNPADNDYTGIQPNLVNSIDEVSGVKLSPLAPSDKKMTFGATRSVANGFYEAQATLSAEDIESVKADFSVDALKDLVKDILSKKDGVNLTNIYELVQDQVSDVLDANGVKVSWTDAFGTHSVYSDYSVAATAIKPLSFHTLAGASYSIPSITALDNIDMHIEYAKYEGVDGTDLYVYIDMNKDGVAEKYPIQDVQKLIDEINTDVAAKLTNDINHLINEIKDQTAGNINKYMDKAKNLIGKVDNIIARINHVLSDPNYYLQPCMAYQAANGNYYQVSNAVYAPSHFALDGEGAQGIELIPTTFTAEILAPAYKKYVAVTNVISADGKTSAQDGDATCKAALKLANEGTNMNEVFGGKDDVLFQTSSEYEGFVYEIAYSAVDYSGYNVTRRYYVKVVK